MVVESGLGIGIELIRNIFVNTTFMGNFIVVQLAVLVASMLMISRNFNDWKVLALPIIAGWHTIGFSFQWVFFAGASLTFVMSLLSLEAIDKAIGAVREGIKGIGTERFGDTGKIRRIKKKKVKMDVKMELLKLKDPKAYRKIQKAKEISQEVEDLKQKGQIAPGLLTEKEAEKLKKLQEKMLLQGTVLPGMFDSLKKTKLKEE